MLALSNSICRGGPAPDWTPARIDLLLLADCVYFEPAFPLLIETMGALLGADTECLFCYKKRRKVRRRRCGLPEAKLTIFQADKRFFAQAKRTLTFTPVRQRDAAARREPVKLILRRQVDDDPAAALYARDGIFLYRVTRRGPPLAPRRVAEVATASAV